MDHILEYNDFKSYTFDVISNKTNNGGKFEIKINNVIYSKGEYEFLSYPIIENDIPLYKIVLNNNSRKLSSKTGYQKQLHLFNIVSHEKGFGSILIENIVKWANQNSYKTIWLNVVKTNNRAIALYKKYGFKIDEQFDKLSDKNIIWYRMYKIIH